MIKAEIVADSINPSGNRLTTFVLTYPRFVHAEFMTHRMISKNSASSRAIPSKKMIQDIVDTPAWPEFWGKNQAGMQAAEEIPDSAKRDLIDDLTGLRDEAIRVVEKAQGLYRLHKQIANRYLEPWFHMRVIATATEWDNFFFLRCHPAAQPEIQALADAMLYQYCNSTPTLKQPGEWHLPFTDKLVGSNLNLTELKRISTARCARVSYLNFDGGHDPSKDYELHDRLVGSHPGHWSPAEHPAESQPDSTRWGNLIGWRQYRKFFLGRENAKGDLKKLLADRINAGSKYANGQ